MKGVHINYQVYNGMTQLGFEKAHNEFRYKFVLFFFFCLFWVLCHHKWKGLAKKLWRKKIRLVNYFERQILLHSLLLHIIFQRQILCIHMILLYLWNVYILLGFVIISHAFTYIASSSLNLIFLMSVVVISASTLSKPM